MISDRGGVFLPMATQEREIIRMDQLPAHDDVRRDFEQRAEYVRQQPPPSGHSNPMSDPGRERAIDQVERYNARPTDVKLPDPSGSIRNFCQHCGNSIRLSQPTSEPRLAARLQAQGVMVEVFQSGEVDRNLAPLIQVIIEALRDRR